LTIKTRLDVLITDRGLAESRSLAQRLIMAGQVRVADQVVTRPADRFPDDAIIDIQHGPQFVSRGGEKLLAALTAFDLTVLTGWICADIGASTGGFTDCLLQHGATKVYAVDVGYGVLHWKLRQDTRVISMERTNARFITRFPEDVRLVTMDVSFISLRVFWEKIPAWFGPAGGEVVALIKPQFEAGRKDTARGAGVIRDSEIHRRVIMEVLTSSASAGFTPVGIIRSPLMGPKGNTEFLTHLRYPRQQPFDIGLFVENAFKADKSSPDLFVND
jgi:23S rRNA (cytidine1920-2'-O)/16S rRNA (cytidine1409-2'-O)-methyltransferase